MTPHIKQSMTLPFKNLYNTILSLITLILNLHTSCASCGQIGQGVLCKNCLKQSVFAPAQCLFCEQYAQTSVHKQCLPKIFTTWLRPNSNKNKEYSIPLLNIHMYNYNQISKNLLLSIKTGHYSFDTIGLKLLIKQYFKIDPFNLIRNILEFANQSRPYIVINPIPNSPKSQQKRGFNVSNIIARYFFEILQNRLTQEIHTQNNRVYKNIQIVQLFKNHGKTSQKSQTNKTKRIQHSLASIKLNTKHCLQLVRMITYKYQRKGTKYHFVAPKPLLFILLDDIATTNSTMLNATTQTAKCISLIRNSQVLPKIRLTTITIFKKQKA